MGTNYYLRTGECDGCGRYDQEFIGKSSMGWSFCFRGHLPNEYELQYENATPLGQVFQWREKTKHGEIYDEYGKAIDYEAFWARVESSQNLKKDRGKNQWIDPEGYCFMEASSDASW